LEPKKVEIKIKAPNIQHIRLRCDGTAPLMISRFWKKAEMMAEQAEGGARRRKRKSDARDYDSEANQARHISTDGWDGIHAGSFRNGMISACRTVGFKMTLAKLAVSVVADGFDREDGTPLVRIYGQHVTDVRATRNADGSTALRARPRYDSWHLYLDVQYDADMFTATDICNLMWRVGAQVGVGEGRPDSRDSPGIGFGTFSVSPADMAVAAE